MTVSSAIIGSKGAHFNLFWHVLKLWPKGREPFAPPHEIFNFPLPFWVEESIVILKKCIFIICIKHPHLANSFSIICLCSPTIESINPCFAQPDEHSVCSRKINCAQVSAAEFTRLIILDWTSRNHSQGRKTVKTIDVQLEAGGSDICELRYFFGVVRGGPIDYRRSIR